MADSMVRVALGKNINVSGIANDGMSGKWRAQAWRMEIVSIDRPASAADSRALVADLVQNSPRSILVISHTAGCSWPSYSI